MARTTRFSALRIKPMRDAAADSAPDSGIPCLMAKVKYDFAVHGGAIGTINLGSILPDNAIVVGGIINPTTAPVGATATIAFGTSAGSSNASIKAATAVATFTPDALLPTVPVWTAGSAFKMTAAGGITMTIAVAPLTAGVIEATVYYFVAAG